MGYELPGYSPRPDSVVAVNSALLLQERLAHHLPTIVAECFKAVSSKTTKIRTLPVYSFLQATNSVVSAEKDLLLSLHHVLFRILYYSGFITRKPERPVYRPLPFLSIDEAVDKMIDKVLPWPTKDDLGGEDVTNEQFQAIMPRVLADLAWARNMRPNYVEYLRRKVGDVAWKLQRGIPIDQAERTLLLSYHSTSEGELGFSKYADNNNPIPLVENGDPRVDAAFQLYKQSVEIGPFLRFTRIVSNQRRWGMLMWLGPIVDQLPIRLMHANPMGPFTELTSAGETDEVIKWTDVTQLDALEEAASQLQIGSAFFLTKQTEGVQPYYRVPLPLIVTRPVGADVDDVERVKAKPYPMSLDHPDITLRMKTGASCADQIVWEYVSGAFEGMTLRSDTNATEETLMTDFGLSAKTHGQGAHGRLTLDEFDLLDLTEVESEAQGRIVRDEELVEEIFYPASDGSGLTQAQVDLKRYYLRDKRLMVRPALLEYAMPQMADLHIQDDAVEQEIATQLGLTPMQQRLAARTGVIRASHNYARLKRLMGRGPAIPLGIRHYVHSIYPSGQPDNFVAAKKTETPKTT